MKKFFIGLAVVGVIAAIAGGVIFAIGLSTSKNGNNNITRTVEVEDSFENFDFDLMTSDIEVKKSVDGKNKVEIVEKEKISNVVKVEDNTLKIKQEDSRKWYEKIFDWSWTFDDLKVTVYVAEGTYNNFVCGNNTGAIVINSGFTFSTMNVTSNTGSIKVNSNVTGAVVCENNTGSITLSDITAASINATGDTGSVNFTNVTVSGDIKAEADTGSVNFDNTRCVNIDVDSGTGSVNLKNTIASGNIKIESSTGSIKFDHSDADSLNLKSSTGSIKGTLLTSKIFQASSSTGSVKVPTSTTGGLCVVHTSTGTIDLSIANA